MPSIEELNEVGESLFKGGTRFRAEKLIILAAYFLVVVGSGLWAFVGVAGPGELKGELEINELEEIDTRSFNLANTGSDDWKDVRVAVNQRYLWHADAIDAETSRQIQPRDMTYFYEVPRPWGHALWETVAEVDKPPKRAPKGLEVNEIKVRSGRHLVDLARSESD